MVPHESPCIALGLCFRKEHRQPFDEVFTIRIIIEDLSPLYASDHDMVQETGCIESRRSIAFKKKNLD